MRQICKRFGEKTALDRVDFSVGAREIHALLGENGAGKTTLMNLLYGLHRPDAGEIFLFGRPARLRSPHQAMRAGIAMVHQHFMLSPALTVAENIALALPRRAGVFFNRRRLEAECAALAKTYSLAVHPGARVAELSVGEQQRVEILKALALESQVLVLDEPTALLTPQETRGLFGILRRIQKEGKTVVFITHKLEEARELCSRASVLREGRMQGVFPLPATTAAQLASRMMGDRKIEPAPARPAAKPGFLRLKLHRATLVPRQNGTGIRGVTLELREGEIAGVVGVDGNGQRELVEAVRGTRPLNSGKRADFVNRIGYIPADRRGEGLILNFSIEENFLLHSRFLGECSPGGVLRRRRARRFAEHLIRHYSIAAAGPKQRAGELSGGNQQKVAAARALALKPRVLVAVNPTWGLDVESASFIRRQLERLRAEGAAVLLVTLDLEEAIGLSDRLFALYNGRLREIPRPDWNIETLGLAMTGAS